MSLAAEDRKGFRDEVARTLFVTAWADWMDQYGPGTPGMGAELMDCAPETPEYVYEKADELISRLEKEIAPLEVLFERARATWEGKSPRGSFLGELAYCLTMASLGHGVGWTDYHDEFEGHRGLWHFEFTYYDLDDENYPIPDSEEEP